MSRTLRVAVDVGGTFTDICVLDEREGAVRVAKVPSTADPIEGVLGGITEAGVDLGEVALFSHGTTVATNALITRRLPTAAMATTRGFRDVLEIRRGTKEDLWDAYKDVAPPYIRRRDRLEVTERIDYAGNIVTPLDEAEAREVAARLRRRNVAAVAVCFVNAYTNPAHERRMREILEEELPGVAISTSSEVLPEIFEHERFSTTVANAILAPLVGEYTNRMGDRLAAGGYDGDLLLLHSGGGVMTPKSAGELAVRLAASGIAAGAIASRHISTLCEPTNTDANLVLGRLGDRLIGGAMSLDRAAAERAIETHVAGRLGLGSEEAAIAILQVANANMADAVRLISIRRGYDPREFALVVFGGAGPLHGVALARELSIPTVLVPPNPGITSALGCLLVDIRHDLSIMYLARTDRVDGSQLEQEFTKLEAEAHDRLEAEGVAEDQMQLQRLLDMRYLGQWRSMSIPVGSPLDLDRAVAMFHSEHEREHNYRRDKAAVEIYRLNIRATGVTPKAELRRHDANGAGVRSQGTRSILFDEAGEPIETPVFARETLTAGTVIEGPAVIDQLDSTTLVPPGIRAEVDEWLNIRIHVGTVG